jgi:endonuclease G
MKYILRIIEVWPDKKYWLIAFIICYGISSFGQTIKHKAYTVYFNQSIRSADSVSWDLNPSMVSCSKVTRGDMFAPDPDCKNSPVLADYLNSHFDRGHLMSYESAMCDNQTRKECFYLDQMYPQPHPFNAGDWKTVEQYEQTLAKTNNIHIIAGYIGSLGKLRGGENIPAFMYKAILCKGVYTAWIMPNLITSHGHKVDYWKVDLKTLDSKTGLRL